MAKENQIEREISKLDEAVESLGQQIRDTRHRIEQAREANERAASRGDKAGADEHGQRFESEEAHLSELRSRLHGAESALSTSRVDLMKELVGQMTPEQKDKLRQMLQSD